MKRFAEFLAESGIDREMDRFDGRTYSVGPEG